MLRSIVIVITRLVHACLYFQLNTFQLKLIELIKVTYYLRLEIAYYYDLVVIVLNIDLMVLFL